MQIESMLTRGKTARRLGVSDVRVDQLVAAGRLHPALHTPLGRLFDASDVDRLAAEREVTRANRRNNDETPAAANG